MTIEGRPEINHDWDAAYRKQRRDRLDDAIAEYMNDDKDMTARQCYEEILSSIETWVTYHKDHFDRWTALKSLMLGHREVNFSDPVFLTEDRNSNFPGENTLTMST